MSAIEAVYNEAIEDLANYDVAELLNPDADDSTFRSMQFKAVAGVRLRQVTVLLTEPSLQFEIRVVMVITEVNRAIAYYFR